jgi:ATPase
MKIDKLVPDTSVIVEGVLSKRLEKKELKVKKVIMPEAVLAELEHQANLNRVIGDIGLDEVESIRSLSQSLKFELEFSGTRPRMSDIKMAKQGEIDALIRDMAYSEDATLFTADKVQAKIAQAKGMKVLFAEVKRTARKLEFEKFFDKETMSIHLRENVLPYAKKGVPGNWRFVALKKKKLGREKVRDIAHEIIEEAEARKDGFVEIDRPGSTIVQLGLFRIVITRPPFADGWEITAVKPIKKMTLDNYKLSEKLSNRISEQAEGILIAGAPGHGKTTFAAALAEHYMSQDKIVKTVEAPRDLVLPEEITQYAISHGTPQEVHDILLLSRPDYTIFDEMRNTADFKLFADLRLAGIGLAGVVHATNPIDAIQRFVGRIELGVIPQIIDTVIFIKDGFVHKVLSLNMTVKVPSGMTEADLARPVVVVNDFETKRLEYELYTYGEETVVIPVRTSEKTPSKALASNVIEKEFKKYARNIKVDMVSDHKARVYVPQKCISKIIGRQGKNIDRIEKRLGIGIDIQPSDAIALEKKQIAYEASITKKNVMFYVDTIFVGKDADIFIDEDYVLTAKVGKKGIIKVSKKHKIGKVLQDAINMNEDLRLVLK